MDSTHPKNGLVKEPSTQILKVQVLPHGEGLELPSYQTPHSAGMDLRAATESPLSLRPLQRTLIPTGIKIAIPEGYKITNLEDLNMDVFSENGDEKTMEFTCAYEVNGNILTVTCNEYYNEIRIPLSRYEEFRSVINAAADFNKITLVFEKK